MAKKNKDISPKIKYVQTSSYNSLIATGVYGGFSPNGFINMNFYIERLPIPEEQDLKVNLIRDVSHSVLLDLPTAKAVQEWLNNHISEYENALLKTQEKSEQ